MTTTFSLRLTGAYTFSFEYCDKPRDQKEICDSHVPVLADLTPECRHEIQEGSPLLK